MKKLRERALAILHKAPSSLQQIAPDDLKALVHELQVHQVELEMQNEELLNTRLHLERSQSEYASLYDDAPIGYLTLNQDGRIHKLNNAVANLLDHPRAQLTGVLLLNFILKDDRNHFSLEFRRVMESGKHGSCTFRLQSRNGISYIHFECQAVQHEDGNKLLRVTMTDISARVRSEEQLQISRRQLEAALQVSACGIWDWPDTEQDHLWWSPDFFHLLGYESGDIRSGYSTFKSLLHQADRKRVISLIDKKIRSGDSYDTTFRLRCRNGTYRWFRNYGGTVRSSHTRRHMAGLLQDVTDKHDAEEQLIRAKQEAEQASREKSRFLAAASHDLRQPLHSMSMYLGVLRRLTQSESALNIIEKTEVSARTMERLLRSLLNLSRLEAGIISPEFEPFALQDMFDSLYITNEPLAQTGKLQLKIRPTKLEVTSDRVLLEELIQNLVTNALQHTGQGGVLLGCRYRAPHVWIQVWDTGPGIPPDKLKELVDNGHTVYGRHGADTIVNDGIRSGLGFAIIRRIADILSCPLHARSVPDQGTVFTIEIPLSGKLEIPVNQRVYAPATGLTGVSILLIDDDASVLDSYHSLALNCDYRIETAKNLSEAMRRLDEGLVPDVIISDLRLKRESGVSVIRKLREQLGTQVPAVLLTGDTSTIEADIHSTPSCKVIYKPVNFDILLQVVEDLVKN
jgi:PAS domain S-box-containing protein